MPGGGGVVGGLVVGGGAVVGGGVVGVVEPVHTVPLRVNELGDGLAPVKLPLKPMLVLAPVPSEPFQLALRAVTELPLWLQVADQPWVSRWPPSGKVNPRVQLLSASPRLVTVTLAVNPPDQLFVV
ncbi:hypothetical protein GCM10029963_04980 [Micromonospora andamanensis]